MKRLLAILAAQTTPSYCTVPNPCTTLNATLGTDTFGSGTTVTLYGEQ